MVKKLRASRLIVRRGFFMSRKLRFRILPFLMGIAVLLPFLQVFLTTNVINQQSDSTTSKRPPTETLSKVSNAITYNDTTLLSVNNNMWVSNGENHIAGDDRKGLPIIVVGFPKSGTTSIYSYFNCSGLKTQHYCSRGDLNNHPPCAHGSMAQCMLENLAQNNTNIFDGCGDYQVYAQIDGERPTRKTRRIEQGSRVFEALMEDGSWATIVSSMRQFLPQHFLLDKIHAAFPNATLVLPLRRDAKAWAISTIRWFRMRVYFYHEYMAHNASESRPKGADKEVAWLERIYNEHTAVIKSFVQEHPSHRLVVVNVSDPTAGTFMEETFGYDSKCWGHSNAHGNRSGETEKAKELLQELADAKQ